MSEISQQRKNNLRNKARQKYWSSHDRAGYECADCGRAEAELLESFEVHHIDGDVSNNCVENLVGLCQVCHNLREGKKPSLRKTSHLVTQYSGGSTQNASPVPVCRSDDEYAKYVNNCFEINKPALVINMKNARKWAQVEYDLLALEGVFTLKNRGREIGAGLNQEAVSIVQRVLQRYEDVETGGNSTGALAIPSESSTGGFRSFPGMKLNDAKRLASELKPIVENPMNWTPNPSHNNRFYRHIVEEDGSAEIVLNDLEWLPHQVQRHITITEGDLKSECDRCDTLISDGDADHCEQCRRELAWKYNNCDHKQLESFPAPDDDRRFGNRRCTNCGLEKPAKVV